MENFIGILITSYSCHYPWFRKSIDSFLNTSYPTILGYDEIVFPYNLKILGNIELIVTGIKLGIQEGERWQILKGCEEFKKKGLKYILKVSGDQIISLPLKIPFLIEHLGESKIISCGTEVFFAEIDSLIQVIKLWDTNPELHGCCIEEFFENGFNFLNYERKNKSKREWYELLGWRHLHHECLKDLDPDDRRFPNYYLELFNK